MRMLGTASESLIFKFLTAGLFIKEQPSERGELPRPIPDQTEGQPIKEDAADTNTKVMKIEAGESISSFHNGATGVKAEDKPMMRQGPAQPHSRRS